MISGTLHFSVDSCRLEQMTFNKYRKYSNKNKHIHDKICCITQSKRGYSMIAECRDALNSIYGIHINLMDDQIHTLQIINMLHVVVQLNRFAN